MFTEDQTLEAPERFKASKKKNGDLKGLISSMSLSSTDQVSDHDNDNQASQNTANNDWD